jgi:hypothetical protein
MSEMVERVARAIHDSLIKKGGPGRTMMPWGHAPEREWCLATARAAIASMREPTKGMVEAGETAKDNAIDSDYDSRSDSSYTTIRSDIHEAIWSAMVAAALSKDKRA